MVTHMTEKITSAIQTITSLVESEQYPPNSRLPTEREMAAQFGMPRSTIRKALDVLEAQSKIWRHVGRGTFVGPHPNAKPADPVEEVTFSTNPAEIMETRQIIEPKTASLAAIRATQADLDKMAHCLNRAKSATDFDTFERWDGLFHLAIAESTHNSLIVSFFKTIDNLRHDSIWGRLKEAAITAKRQQTYIRQHEDLLDAIQNREPSQAEKVMRHHLDSIQKNLLGNI